MVHIILLSRGGCEQNLHELQTTIFSFQIDIHKVFFSQKGGRGKRSNKKKFSEIIKIFRIKTKDIFERFTVCISISVTNNRGAL
jgi:hypothetical protein